MNLEHLNQNQMKAVTLPLGPSLVIAGPGSGKTHVIIHRIAYMIEKLGCRPSEMLVITFTKAAAEEMKIRFRNQFGDLSVSFGTFHSAFFRMLRVYDADKYHIDNLLSEDTKRKIIETIYKKMDCDKDEDFVELFLKHLTLMRNQMIQPKYYHPDGLSEQVYLDVYRQYEMYKDNQSKFDFDDMLVDCYELLKNEPSLLEHFSHRYRYLLIDEFQDINLVQFEVIKLLTKKHRNIFVVGDDDQSIYGFRGAKPELIWSYKDYFNECQEVILDINYRSTQKILDYCNALILNNTRRYAKKMKTVNSLGEKPSFIQVEDIKEEASFILSKVLKFKEKGIKWSECAIIYRTNIEVRPLIELFLAANIPFYLRDTLSTLYDSWVTKDILAYLKLSGNKENNELMLRIINRPSRYISKACLEEVRKKEGKLLNHLLHLPSLNEWQKAPLEELIYHLQVMDKLTLTQKIDYIRKRIGYDHYIDEYAKYRSMPSEGLIEILDELQASSEDFKDVTNWEEHLYELSLGVKQNSQNKASKKNGITLTTMHSAKGLEFKMVFILNGIDGVTPHSKSQTKQALEEERRLFYVACTRAKEKLFICIPKTRYNKKTFISPFIQEMLTQKISVGTKITHKKYGKGIVIKLEENKAQIKFEDGQMKLIDYGFSLKNNIITTED